MPRHNGRRGGRGGAQAAPRDQPSAGTAARCRDPAAGRPAGGAEGIAEHRDGGEGGVEPADRRSGRGAGGAARGAPEGVEGAARDPRRGDQATRWHPPRPASEGPQAAVTHPVRPLSATWKGPGDSLPRGRAPEMHCHVEGPRRFIATWKGQGLLCGMCGSYAAGTTQRRSWRRRAKRTDPSCGCRCRCWGVLLCTGGHSVAWGSLCGRVMVLSDMFTHHHSLGHVADRAVAQGVAP